MKCYTITYCIIMQHSARTIQQYMCIVVTLCLVVKKQKHNILVLSPLSITRLIYIKQNLMNRLSVSDDFHRLFSGGLMRRPITSLWVQTHPNVLIPKSLGKKKHLVGGSLQSLLGFLYCAYMYFVVVVI